MEQVLAKRPGIFELVTGAWRSVAAAAILLLPVLAVVAAGVFGLDYVFPILEEKLRVIRPASSSLFVLMVVPGAWLFGLEQLALGLVLVPAALVTQRRILADDGPHLAPGPLLRFWLWALVAMALALGCLYLSGLAATPDVQLVSLVLKLLAILIPLLLLPIFPAVAADEASAGPVDRMDKGLMRWDGNFWRLAVVALFTIGPAWLLLKIPAAIAQRGGIDPEKFYATLVGGVVHAALLVLVVVIASAALAHWFTVARLPKPPAKPLGT